MEEKNDISEVYLKLLGNRIKQLRIKSGYTNYEIFAYDNNISRSQYGRYEKGHNISFKTLLKIIKAHNISIQEFFNEGFQINDIQEYL